MPLVAVLGKFFGALVGQADRRGRLCACCHRVARLRSESRGRPLMSRSLHRLYSERAVRSGLASYIRQRPILAEPELRRRGGHRPIALEGLLTRRELRQRAPQPRVGRLRTFQDEIA